MKQRLPLTLFISAETILYGLIMTSHGKVLIYSQFTSIVLCFLFATLHLSRKNYLMVLGAILTVGADFCLVICDPIQQLGGMVFFLFAQSCYATHLYRAYGSRSLLALRLIVSVLVIPITFLVLQAQTDALALVSMVYYTNLVMNLIAAIHHRKHCPLMIPAFLLFILCDTVIGLQVATSGYLPIAETSLLHSLLFSPFPLAWFFYLPSQVLLVLHSRKENGRTA